MKGSVSTMILMILGHGFALAQQEGGETGFNYPDQIITVPSWRLAHGPHVRAAFREVVAKPRESVVAVKSGGVKVALGGVVDSRGWILTKASTLGEAITCELDDGREMRAAVKATDREYDVALLKIDAADLPALEITEGATPVVGSWLATVGLDSYPVAVGIVSVEPREIPHQAGILGIQLDSEMNVARVLRVLPGSAAAKAGLLASDVIVEIEGKETPTRDSMVARVQEFSPGDTVKLKVQRGDEQVSLSAVLMGRFPGIRTTRNEFQNRLGSDLSERRFGFASAFQHDTVVEAADVGGPVVNLDGQVVGFNIARSGRTETYGIAAASLVKTIKELMEKSE